MTMYTMVSTTSLPPYNRFDKTPRHALQCGVSPVEQHSTHHRSLNEHYYQNNPHSSNTGRCGELDRTTLPNEHRGRLSTKFNSTGSRTSLASSTSSTISHESLQNGSSDSGTDVRFNIDSPHSPQLVDSGAESLPKIFSRNLYIDKSTPPPYNKEHKTKQMPTNTPSHSLRKELPKKSIAAQQSVAELLQEDTPEATKATPCGYGK